MWKALSTHYIRWRRDSKTVVSGLQCVWVAGPVGDMPGRLKLFRAQRIEDRAMWGRYLAAKDCQLEIAAIEAMPPPCNTVVYFRGGRVSGRGVAASMLEA